MGRIRESYYRIKIPTRKGQPEKPVRIAVIGDLHGRLFGEGNGQLTETILRRYPDMVLSVGDLIVSNPKKTARAEVGIALLKRLACDCPVYCVNGNHEGRAKEHPGMYQGIYARFAGEMRRAGITLLENENVCVDINGARLVLHGLELAEKYYRKMGKACISAQEIRETIGTPQEGRFNILLVHSPVYFESYALWGADLTLAGHLHGGLVRLPFAGGLISPQVRLFPRYDKGLFEKYGRKMVVTSGLGSHSHMIRVNNPPEVVLLELA